MSLSTGTGASAAEVQLAEALDIVAPGRYVHPHFSQFCAAFDRLRPSSLNRSGVSLESLFTPLAPELQYTPLRFSFLHKTGAAFAMLTGGNSTIFEFFENVRTFIRRHAEYLNGLSPEDPNEEIDPDVSLETGLAYLMSDVWDLAGVLFLSPDERNLDQILAAVLLAGADPVTVPSGTLEAADLWGTLKTMYLNVMLPEAIALLERHREQGLYLDHVEPLLKFTRGLALQAHSPPSDAAWRRTQCTSRARAVRDNESLRTLYRLLAGDVAAITAHADSWRTAIAATLVLRVGPINSRAALWNELMDLDSRFEGIQYDEDNSTDEICFHLVRGSLAHALITALDVDPWLGAHLAALIDQAGPKDVLPERTAAHCALFHGWIVLASRGGVHWQCAQLYWGCAPTPDHVAALHRATLARRDYPNNPRRQRALWATMDPATARPLRLAAAARAEAEGRPAAAARQYLQVGDADALDRVVGASILQFARDGNRHHLAQFQALDAKGSLLDLVRLYLQFLDADADARAAGAARSAAVPRCLAQLFDSPQLPIYLLPNLLHVALLFLEDPTPVFTHKELHRILHLVYVFETYPTVRAQFHAIGQSPDQHAQLFQRVRLACMSAPSIAPAEVGAGY
ncbi:hypothetical protein H9P43_000302 [Blastocladiella emersonii ATCC 22665]|nr:hypothetical protein H9P43_000302 [Blastocladiella emersonii ATCC 22665]